MLDGNISVYGTNGIKYTNTIKKETNVGLNKQLVNDRKLGSRFISTGVG